MPQDVGNTATNVAYPLEMKLPEKGRPESKHKPRRRVKKLPHKKAVKMESKQYKLSKRKEK